MRIYCVLSVINLMQCEAGLRVLGGRDALKDEFPYVVRLEYEHAKRINETVVQLIYERFCTGSAIRATWILTAAHCIEPKDFMPSKKFKIVARYNSHFPTEFGQVTRITGFHIHPGFTNDINNMKDDVGLCRCESIPISMFGKISAVNFRTFVGHETLLLGFGQTNESSIAKPLQVLKVMVNKCLPGDEEKGEMMFCLVPPCNLIATSCGGDSGGPIVHPSGIIGVVSMSIDDCYENMKPLVLTPGTSANIFATLSPRINWLSNIISNKTGWS